MQKIRKQETEYNVTQNVILHHTNIIKHHKKGRKSTKKVRKKHKIVDKSLIMLYNIIIIKEGKTEKNRKRERFGEEKSKRENGSQARQTD